MQSVGSDIAGALGVGSGINTAQLVADLVQATRQPRASAIGLKQTTNNARISALASAKSSLNTFSTALTELLKSSDYSGKPASNDVSIAAVSLIPGAPAPRGLPAQIEVRQLAQAQVVESATLSAATAVAGTGTLTFAVGAETFDITLEDPTNTLADLASAINAADMGVTASVAVDKNGARLVLKGESGADQAFSITAGVDADTDLQRFTYDATANTGSLTRRQPALDALITLDGVEMQFEGNTITTAIPNLRIDLNKAAPGTSVTLATDQPAATMKDLVEEFVSAYNNLKSALNASTAPAGSGTGSGLLSGDGGVRTMVQRLSQLASTDLASSGPYRRLTDIGVKTNRDGTLSLDTVRLEKALADDPAAVTQMLNPSTPDADNPGLGGALKKITDFLNGTDGPLASSAAVYDKLKTSFADQLEELDTRMDSYEAQLSKTFGAMQTRLLAFKATQTYLDQQIQIWNNN